MKKHLWPITVLLVTLVLGCTSPTPKTPKTSETPKEIREKKIKKQFLQDDSHIGLTKAIKESMHNPNSYEHVKTRWIDRGGNFLIIMTEFRGTNKFGGVIKNGVIAKVDLEGNVIEIIKSLDKLEDILEDIKEPQAE